MGTCDSSLLSGRGTWREFIRHRPLENQGKPLTWHIGPSNLTTAHPSLGPWPLVPHGISAPAFAQAFWPEMLSLSSTSSSNSYLLFKTQFSHHLFQEALPDLFLGLPSGPPLPAFIFVLAPPSLSYLPYTDLSFADHI